MQTQLHFGDLELDLLRYELRRDGRVVKLERIPMELLILLVEQRGRLVTREEIAQKIWGKDVFVDTENAINTAVRKVRVALKDDPARPRMVERVPGKGYRFNADVIAETGDEARPRNGNPGNTHLEQTPAASQAPATVAPALNTQEIILPGQGSKTARSRYHRTLLVIAGAALLLGMIYALRPVSSPPKVVRVTQLTKYGEAFPLEPLLTDGPRVYYLASLAGTSRGICHVRQVLLNGNEDTLVPNIPDNFSMQALSPDNTEFLARNLEHAIDTEDQTFWILPVVGGAPRRIGDLSAHSAAWSHDGRSIAYAHGKQLFLANIDGANPRLLAEMTAEPSGPVFSPDDQRLRFTVLGPSGLRALWEVKSDGGNLHELKELRVGDAQTPIECCGAWSPDGHYFIFQSRRDDTYSLWMVQEQSDWLHRINPKPVQLTVGPMNYYQPILSRDGKTIFAIGQQPAGELLRYDTSRQEFAPFLGGISADHLDFSRDRRWVAYVSYPEGTLWRARADGGESLQLTFPPLRAYEPRFSPDGRSIAFSATRAGEPWKIYTIPVDGGNPEPLITEPYAQSGPEWLPGGDALLYSRVNDPEGNDVAIYRVDLQTRRAAMVAGSEGLSGVRVSPNGRDVAGVAGPNRRLVLLDLKTGKTTLLTEQRADYPTWSADSRYVYFNTLMTSKPALYRVPVAGGGEEKVAEVKFGVAGIWGAWSGLAPDGSLLVLRRRYRSDIYALSLSPK